MSTLFDSSEHRIIPDGLMLPFPEGPQRAGSYPLSIDALFAFDHRDDASKQTLTYGQIVALGGDFYGIPGQRISDGGVDAFSNAYGTLVAGKSQELLNILAIMDDEQKAVDAAIANHLPPSQAYKDLGWLLSYRWNEATGGGAASLKTLGLAKMGRYMQLSQDNLDHFGADAVKSYSAGHLAAMMVVIKTMGADAFARRAALEQAYAINAFADHFLTDLFSAGHIRTPRRALVEKMPNDPFSAGLCALVMHDEENAAGLNVANAAGDRWKAYGDGYLLDAGRYPGVVDDRANLAMVRAAVKASIAEVYDVWTTGVIPSSYASLALVPVSPPDPTDRSNPSPLFCMIDDVVAIRSDGAGGIGGPKAYVWDKDWSPLDKGIQAGLGIVTSAIEDWIKKVGRIPVWDTPDFPPTNFEPPKPPAQAL